VRNRRRASGWGTYLVPELLYLSSLTRRLFDCGVCRLHAAAVRFIARSFVLRVLRVEFRAPRSHRLD
jgi:hypothetical protein